MHVCTHADVPTRTPCRRVRLGTRWALGVVVVGSLLYDWDSYLGTDQHIFGGIRPAVRRTLDWAWGVQKPGQQQAPQQQQQQQQQALAQAQQERQQ